MQEAPEHRAHSRRLGRPTERGRVWLGYKTYPQVAVAVNATAAAMDRQAECEAWQAPYRSASRHVRAALATGAPEEALRCAPPLGPGRPPLGRAGRSLASREAAAASAAPVAYGSAAMADRAGAAPGGCVARLARRIDERAWQPAAAYVWCAGARNTMANRAC